MGDKAVALVTGSGAGIGRGIAIRLASDGYAVILNSRSADPDKPDEGAYEVKSTIEKTGGEAEVCRGDVSVEADRRRMIDFAGETFGRLDLLVNNAGVAPKERLDILEASEESFERVLSINLQGPYFLTQFAARRMIEWKQAGVVETPRICFVSSISAYMSSPNRGEYCVSKAGLSMGAKLFAHRLAEEGIPVVEICPGIIETRMTAGVKEKYDSVIAGGLVPARRWGQPEDIASVVSAFARGDLDFCNGSVIEAGGGIGIQRL